MVSLVALQDLSDAAFVIGAFGFGFIAFGERWKGKAGLIGLALISLGTVVLLGAVALGYA